MIILDVNPEKAYMQAVFRYGRANVRRIFLPEGRYSSEKTPRGKFLKKISNFDVIVKISSKSQGAARLYCKKDDYEFLITLLKEVIKC